MTDRMFHALGAILTLIVFAALYLGREWLAMILWAFFS